MLKLRFGLTAWWRSLADGGPLFVGLRYVPPGKAAPLLAMSTSRAWATRICSKIKEGAKCLVFLSLSVFKWAATLFKNKDLGSFNDFVQWISSTEERNVIRQSVLQLN
jgi:hypothetical protein